MVERVLISVATIALAAALIAVALGVAAERGGRDATSVAKSATELKLGNNKRRRPVIRFFGMAPGDKRKRRVRISNRRGPARLYLRAVKLKGWAGPNGGSLDEVLRLRVRRIRGARPKRRGKPRRRIYNGPLKEMRRINLGYFKPHSARNYRFKVIFPDRGAPPSAAGGDNAYQGARAKVKFRWRARYDR